MNRQTKLRWKRSSVWQKSSGTIQAEGIVYVGDENGIAGLIAIKDTIRENADEAIKKLKNSAFTP